MHTFTVACSRCNIKALIVDWRLEGLHILHTIFKCHASKIWKYLLSTILYIIRQLVRFYISFVTWRLSITCSFCCSIYNVLYLCIWKTDCLWIDIWHCDICFCLVMVHAAQERSQPRETMKSVALEWPMILRWQVRKIIINQQLVLSGLRFYGGR